MVDSQISLKQFPLIRWAETKLQTNANVAPSLLDVQTGSNLLTFFKAKGGQFSYSSQLLSGGTFLGN